MHDTFILIALMIFAVVTGIKVLNHDGKLEIICKQVNCEETATP